MKRSLFITIGAILLVFSIIGTTVLANQTKQEKQYKLKIIYDDKYVLDDPIDENSNVIVKHGKQIMHDFNMTDNETITLEKINLPNNKLISHWKNEVNNNQNIITPVVVDKNEINIDFLITNGGKIIDEVPLPSITKTVELGTKLSEILPDIESEENYHFAGWFTIEDVENKIEIKEEDREDLKELNSELDKLEKAKDKEKDKEKEKELKSKIEDLKEKIEKAKEETKYDIKVANEYQKVADIDSIELNSDKEYIAVLYPDVNENSKDDRKEEINLKVDFGLENEVHEQKLHVGQPIKLSQPYHENYIFIDWFLDSEFNERLEGQRQFTKDTSLFAQWKTAQEIVSESSENLITEKRISDKVEQYLNEVNQGKYEQQKEISEKKEEELNKKYDEQLVQHTEKRYTLRNFKANQTFLIKFYNDEEFMFSVALPYARTIELLNENGQKVIEYGVRQESSIDLKELINNSENIQFDIKTIKKNNAVITQIYPKNNKKEMN